MFFSGGMIPTYIITTQWYKLGNNPALYYVTGLFAVDTENGTKDEKVEKIKNAIDLIKNSPYYHIYMPNFSAEKVTVYYLIIYYLLLSVHLFLHIRTLI